ncbi:hypothetical protein QBC42DRAFT_220398 [Cladorrhinum samala]|uniref:Amine oxidase domain-containing protein n=1 Tax=Cladorrhinum samala TaxID=585594 RepID=A0AAV9HYE1_9PEZI|nr:hypothetical protein QBC42DRAFT_220398 [Cladorrhinum samala]
MGSIEITPGAPEVPLDIRHLYANFNIEQELQQVIDDLNKLLPPGRGVNQPFEPGRLPDLSNDHGNLRKLRNISDMQCADRDTKESGGPCGEHRVAIVGAGTSGLFLAMMIDYLNEKVPNFQLGYDIFEAADSSRVGGRLFTYNFPAGSDDSKDKEPGKLDYFDVGGMRFPQNPVMERVFELFDWLGMPRVEDLQKDTPKGSLIPYSMTNKTAKDEQNEPFRFNDITKWGKFTDIAASAEGCDAFGFNQNKRDAQIPQAILKEPGSTVDYAVRKVRDCLKKDAERNTQEGWNLLMHYDNYTTREWLGAEQPLAECDPDSDARCPPFNWATINYLETMNGGTNWYDQSFSETVLESLDFNYADSWKRKEKDEYPWWCVMGGAQQLPIRMEERLKSKPRYNAPVSAIRAVSGRQYKMEIDLKTGERSLPYSGVFNTTTLGCLRRIDTTKCDIPNGTKMAMRSLAYGQSCKVGIKFSRSWWKFDLPEERRIKSGGLGHSDMHIRTLVYPSYNILVDEGEPAVLLVSYTWQQDAERIGALISRKSPANEKDLKELLLLELARLHSDTPEEEKRLYGIIKETYRDHYSYDWSQDANAAGAFAFFRPRQFSTLWPKIIQPSGNLVLTGEAASPHHAWVVGALESAVVGLYSWLYCRVQDVPGAAEALKLIQGEGEVDPVTGKRVPFFGLPSYISQQHAKCMGLVAKIRLEMKEEGLL